VLTLTAVLRSSARYDRHGIVRLPLQALSGLGVTDGGIVRLRGRRTTGAVAVLAPLQRRDHVRTQPRPSTVGPRRSSIARSPPTPPS